MAIVISGVNNNDKITATDGTIDLLSGVNFVSEVTVPSFKIGSNIQFGNAGIATATTFVGNLTGNVNATSNLLLQIGGSEKFRVGGSGQLGIAGANYGSSGQVLTSGGSDSAPTWSTIASDKITEGNTSAEVIDTGTDGRFIVTTEDSERLRITSAGKVGINSTTPNTRLDVIESSASRTWTPGTSVVSMFERSGHCRIAIVGGTSSYCQIDFGDTNDDNAGYIKYDHSDNSMSFRTAVSERLRIGGSGGVGINTTLIRNNRFLNIAAPTQDYSNSSTDLMDGGGICFQPTDTLPSTNRTYPGIFWTGNTASLNRSRAGIIGVTASNNDATHIAFLTRTAANGTSFYPSDERMRITNAGNVGISSATPVEKLDVAGSINAGGENDPVLKIHSEQGNLVKSFKHYFDVFKGDSTGNAANRTIVAITMNENFHQAIFEITYGTRLQAVSDQYTRPNKIIFGVNRFNGASSVNVTKTVVEQHSEAASHCDANVVTVSSTVYHLQLEFGTQPHVSSGAGGWVEGSTIIGATFHDVNVYYGVRD